MSDIQKAVSPYLEKNMTKGKTKIDKSYRILMCMRLISLTYFISALVAKGQNLLSPVCLSTKFSTSVAWV